MAVLGRLLVGSAERLDLPDLLSVDSYTAADFKYLVQSFIGSDRPYVLKGFEVIDPQDAIGTENISIEVAESVVYYPGSRAGAFYYGLPEGHVNAQPLIPELRKNAVNFVYLTFNTFDTAKDSRAFWDPDQNGGAGGEFSQDVNTESVLSIDVNVSVSTFPDNTIPICKVKVGSSVIETIQDCRFMMFRLAEGGVVPNPFSTYNFRDDPSAPYARSEPPTTMSSALDPNPFQGGDKNILTLKEWMDVVMTKLKELGGTTYWYEGGSSGSNPTPNVSNIFLDALASTIKSKGQWKHDGTVAGQATWTEDMHHVSLKDDRDVVIRATTINLDNEEVAWLNLVRDVELNNSTQPVTWINGSTTVNGSAGSFVNIAKGDYVKKKSDPSNRYLRVEELYALPNLAGGTTTPALAQSIRLSAAYAGTSGSEVGEYTKGEYQFADIEITARDDAAIQAAAGNFFWIAYRSDTELSLGGITPTGLTINITEADGQRARVTSTVANDLIDGDRVRITTGPYVGTYIVDVADTTNFYIQTTVTGNSLAQSAFYAVVTTAARSTAYGYSLETANHNFQSNEHVTIQGTSTAYDANYQINVRSATTFQIPIGSLITNPGAIAGEIVILPRLNVRTEFGIVKIVQGESTNIGDMTTENLLSFIGMESLAQTKPNYLLPASYNALRGYQNYNAAVDDSLTMRAAKLTAMMADRVQDRGMQFIGRTNITSVTSGANQNISALANLTLVKPSSSDQVITLTTPIALPANSVIVADVSRDSSAAITPVVVSLGNDFLLQENRIILFYRFGTTTVYDWNGNILNPFGHINTESPEDSQNKNVTVFVPGSVKLNPTSGLVVLDIKSKPEISEVTITLAAAAIPQSSYFTFAAANDTTLYYVWYNKNGGGVDPAVVGRTGIMVAVTTGQTANTVASSTATAINTIAGANVTATALTNVVNITNDADGDATDTADFNTTFTFLTLQHGVGANTAIEIVIPGSANNIIDAVTINGLGTLVLADGKSIWARINRFAVKTFNTVATVDGTDTNANGKLYITNTTSVPIDQDVIVLWSRIDNNLLITHQAEREDGNIYEEFIDVITGVPVSPYQLQSPVTANSIINLPPDTRDGSTPQEYIVGSGQLEVYLNGQSLRVGVDYLEVGTADNLSRRIQILQSLNTPDSLGFRIDAQGAVFFATGSGGGGSGTLQDAYDNGRFIAVVTGQPVAITGTSGKLLTVAGDVQIDGVIDPAGITFSQQPSTPFLITEYGLYRNALDHLIYYRAALTPLDLSVDLLYRNGSLPMTGNLDMGGNEILNLSRLEILNTGTVDDTLEVTQSNAGNANPLILLHNAGTGPHITVLAGAVTGETLKIRGGDALGAGASGIVDIRTVNPTGGGATGGINVATANSVTVSATSTSGNISVTTGTTDAAATAATSGSVNVQTGNIQGVLGTAGSISLQVGDSAGASPGGPVTINAGDVATGGGLGGLVSISSGSSPGVGGIGGNIVLTPGTGAVRAGSIILQGNVRRTQIGSNNAVQQDYIDLITLTGGSSSVEATELSFSTANFRGALIDYRIVENTTDECRVGTLYIATSGTNATISDSYEETNDIGAFWTVVYNAGTIQVFYTTTANDKFMRADVKHFR